ncbi:aldo/keto reductase [Emiliania huxleyi CCMP1516]|uniref:NADP-dependent oxidoreductase domain-containing protein n=2 Tax=Emiliania huxleyi TaxID=2903 RepID=A0A0D3JSE6_EMIH1|nr:aldo/keto reductase [Emiliania huxleyi CCMP1516]EOD26431.1 aldo/keto reductase [Emiliania huxleyi CCMP1516]|eukprot:XP_005778860.1 aldo/keto reductase [Emiliania huxleyi CCMP1516]
MPSQARPRRRTLGSSSLEVCEVCLGTMTMGSMTADEGDCHEILSKYVELGGDFLDCAEMYPVPVQEKWVGRSEEIIGTWLAGRSDRDRLVIATKAAPSEADLTRAQILRACDASLKRLQTTHIDLYQIHWPERWVPKWGESQYVAAKAEAGAHTLEGFDAVVSTMGELLSSGKIKHWGLSNETTFGVCMFVEASRRLGVAPPISIQNDFSLCFRTFESELAEACAPAHCNVSLLAYGVLNGGALSGKYLDGSASPGARFNFVQQLDMGGFQGRYKGEQSNAAIREYAALAQSIGVQPAALAQAWAYSREYMGAVIIGATSVAQLEANWAAAKLELSADTLAKIDEIHVRHRNPNLTD